MSQAIALEGHLRFPPMTASAAVQVRLGIDVIPQPSPTLKILRLCSPLSWSKDDLSRFANFARFLLDFIRLISWFFIHRP